VALHYLDPNGSGFGGHGHADGLSGSHRCRHDRAAARLLIDHKDDRTAETTAASSKRWLVSTLQGIIIFVIGCCWPEPSRACWRSRRRCSEFIRLVNWQCGVVALMFATRMLGLVLNAHQRMDLANYIGVGGLVVNFAAQWIFFHFNFGVLSLALGSLVSTLLILVLQALACAALNCSPGLAAGAGCRGGIFRNCSATARMCFWCLSLAVDHGQPDHRHHRMLGLDAAAVWGVGMRVFNLLNQLIWRVSDMSGAAFAEMLARGELARMRDRYRSLAILSFSFAAGRRFPLRCATVCSSPSSCARKIHWPTENDWLLALWMILSAWSIATIALS